MISAEKIPNNVGLSSDKRLMRALEHWQPAYLDWWREMGPPGFQDTHQVYLRTAVSVDAAGWAHFDTSSCLNIAGASSSPSRRTIGGSASATSRVYRSGRKDPENSGTSCAA